LLTNCQLNEANSLSTAIVGTFFERISTRCIPFDSP
jgi:hypothetical protein